MTRPAFVDLSGVVTPTTQEEALASLNPASPIEFCIIDEGFDELHRQEKCKYSVVEFIKKLNSSNALAPNFILAIILFDGSIFNVGDTPEIERRLHYSELGVDFFINRPYGIGQLKSRIQELKKWLTDPPAWTKILASSRLKFEQGQYDQVVMALSPLHTQMPEHFSVAVLLARTLIKQGEDTARKAIPLLLKLQELYPVSTTPKFYYARAAAVSGDLSLAFDTSLEVLMKHVNEERLSSAMEYAQEIVARNRDFAPFSKILSALKTVLEGAPSAKQRARVCDDLTERVVGVEEVKDALNILLEHKDIGSELKTAALILLEHIEAERKKADTPAIRVQSDAIYLEVLMLCLDIESGLRHAIEAFVVLQMKYRNVELASEYLSRAFEDNHISLEYYRALAALSLFSGRLKEASDALQLGRQLKGADDEKIKQLTSIWRGLHKKANAA